MTCPFAREAAFKGGINSRGVDDECREKRCAAWVVTDGGGCCQRLFSQPFSNIDFSKHENDKKQ